MSDKIKIGDSGWWKEPLESVKRKTITSNFELGLQYLYRWMSLMGVLPIERESKCRLCQHIFRASLFSLVMIIHCWMVVHVSINARNVSVSYANGISTAASSWNFVIDNINYGTYVIGIFGFLLLIIRPMRWQDLTYPFLLLEENLKTTDIYSECRRFTAYAIIYNVTSVC